MVSGSSTSRREPAEARQDRDHEPGDHSEPRVELLGHDVSRGIQRHRAQQIDARRVSRCDDKAQQNSVRGVPRDPTRYAATMVLPWPGSRACKAPSPRSRTPVNRNQKLKVWVEMSSVNLLRGVGCWLGRSGSFPGRLGAEGRSWVLFARPARLLEPRFARRGLPRQRNRWRQRSTMRRRRARISYRLPRLANWE